MAVNNPVEGSFDMIQFQLLSQDTGTHFEDEEIQVGLLEHLRFFFLSPSFFMAFQHWELWEGWSEMLTNH